MQRKIIETSNKNRTVINEMFNEKRPIKGQSGFKGKPRYENINLTMPNNKEVAVGGNYEDKQLSNKGFLRSYYVSPQFKYKASSIEDKYGFDRSELSMDQYGLNKLSELRDQQRINFPKSGDNEKVTSAILDKESAVAKGFLNYSQNLDKESVKKGAVIKRILGLPMIDSKLYLGSYLDEMKYPYEFYDKIKSLGKEGSEPNLIETKGNIDDFRYRAYQNKDFDARTQQFKRSDFDRALKNDNTLEVIEKLRKDYPDESIIQLMQILTKNKSDNIPIVARSGAVINAKKYNKILDSDNMQFGSAYKLGEKLRWVNDSFVTNL